MNISDYFYIHGESCDDERIRVIEEALHVELPDVYREVIKACGGGYLSQEASKIAPDDQIGSRVTFLYGNGAHPTQPLSFDLDTAALSTARAQGLPDWGILIGEGEAEHLTPLLLNVAHPELPLGAVFCLDADSRSVVQIATSFEDLWGKITDSVTPCE